MSECLEFKSSMTGSMNSGPLKPQKDSSPRPARSSSFDRRSSIDALRSRSGSPSNRRNNRHQRLTRKMTLTPPAGQPIQLTPLWEHVVRTRRFPTEIDTRLTFLEISERLRDPEWEVRQHALRVLMDVLPTLNADIVDKVMQPVVPELINNLGHPAPAVRKGALDTFRVYLVHSHDREETVKKILQDGLNRSEAHDPFQTNVTTGVILSAPSLLFPSSSSPSPAAQLVKDTTIALASRLAQVPHQEAVLKSLIKIRDAVGVEEFDGYIAEYDSKLKRNIEILAKIYNVKSSKKTQKKIRGSVKNAQNIDGKDLQVDRAWESDSDTSGIVEEEDEIVTGTIPPARVVLETEIKFNEETAITMTILEEKAEDSENEQDEESGTDLRNDVEIMEISKDETEDRRKTPRRVHFGGEIVKLRTPDSDETESIESTQKTKIPLPVFPATKMPERPRRRPSSQPCSPNRERQRSRRESRSVSSSPKREVYTHNADLSPKKSILTRTTSPILVDKTVDQKQSMKKTKKRKNSSRQDERGKTEKTKDLMDTQGTLNLNKETSQNVEEFSKKDDLKLLQSTQNIQTLLPNISEDHATVENVKNLSTNDKLYEEKKLTSPDNKIVSVKSEESKATLKMDEKPSVKETHKSSSRQGKNNGFEVFPRKERNYILMELSSPERKMVTAEKVETDNKLSSQTTIEENKNFEDKTFSSRNTIDSIVSRETNIVKRIDSPFGSVVEEIESDQDIFTKVDRDYQIIRSNESYEKATMDSQSCLTSKLTLKETLKSEDVASVDGTSKKSGQLHVETSKDYKNTDSWQNDVERDPVKSDRGEERSKSDRDKKSVNTIEKCKNVACGSDELENKSGEPSWEELGLVNQEVLDDLHNKDDWRARVRGLERVASALRTSSALIAIEPRLGSLLHAVLGCERSCRVAAAGLAVAKVVVAGVSEDALRKRLPQLAWGLARQGGPSSAQLARIAMLRLRPALLLEQLLQPQCLNARNAKTRENALQLLIFSLVTFPSTEFKVETVANKVAKMVGDRRRRVRQAALDTLAVLAQIYEPEEVLAAGKRAAMGRHDGESMISAIRARLARKSLPLVSADGLVVYGLQISPTVQIATGPDVDWIVAGSGSVSPGTGRTRGQIIATTKSEKGIASRNESTKNRESPWIERPNLVALGVGLRSDTEKPVAWQIVPMQNQDEIHCEDQLSSSENRDVETRNDFGSNDQSRISGESANYRSIIENDLGQRGNFRGESNVKEKESGNKVESRIPVLFSRDRATKFSTRVQDRATNFESVSSNSRRKTKDCTENVGSQADSREGSTSVTCGSQYQRGKRFQQENLQSRVSTTTQVPNQSFDSYNNNYRQIFREKYSTDSKKLLTDVTESTSHEFSENNSRSYQKNLEKDKFLRKSDVRTRNLRSNSSESQQILARNLQRQTPLSHEFSFPRRDARFVNEDTFRALQTAPAPLTRIYNEEDDFGRREILRSRLYRRTKDVSSQKINEIELMSSNTQTNGHFPRSEDDTSYRRRLRSLSPSQLYRRQQFIRLASNEFHTMSMYDIDKAVNEEEYNERNKHHFLPESPAYHMQTINAAEPQFEDDRERVLSKSASSSSSDVSRNNQQQNTEQDDEDRQDYSDSRSSTPQSQDADTAFDIITNQSSPPRDTIDSFVKLEAMTEPINVSLEDDTSKDWSSEEDTKVRNRSRAPSRCSNHSEFIREENQINESDSIFDEVEESVDRTHSRRRSVVSILSTERMQINEILKTSNESLHSSFSKEFHDIRASPSLKIGSPKKSENSHSNHSPSHNSDDFDIPNSSSRRGSRSSPHKLSFENLNEELRDSSEERVISSILNDTNVSFQQISTIQTEVEDSPAIIIASRPHSNEAIDHPENNLEVALEMDEIDNAQGFVDESSINDTLEERQSKDSASETNMEPGILKIEAPPADPISAPKRMPSKVPRGIGKLRMNSFKGNSDKTTEKSKPIVQQCFAQLENKDWEITMKGLKALSQIAKQHPEYLDVSAAGTIGRLLGRHIKNLRSQVARTACLAAGDVFSSQIRGIDQDIDDIAGPLLHRTADTNRFLRADSNAALDQMIEHLPPHKTIGIIVHRGANHQNAIVRAATARLLASIVEKLGPENTMTLPRDVRDKLLNTGARLLIDGNLDARNHAKKLFRRLTHCEGFRRALADAVPETTLRHIDKTLKSL